MNDAIQARQYAADEHARGYVEGRKVGMRLGRTEACAIILEEIQTRLADKGDRFDSADMYEIGALVAQLGAAK